MGILEHIDHFRIDRRGELRLSDHSTRLAGDHDKEDLKEALENDRDRIADLQEKLFAEGTRSLLLIFQAMDASGKDSCVRHVLAGVDPQGVQCWSFKAPSEEERMHDLLWRHAKAIPSKGRIGVHNRSHYEEVLVVKVHPEFLLGQKLAGIDDVKDVKPAFWEQRYESIRNFEEHLAHQGVTIMKFHLRMSLEAQRGRFLERIDEPKKRWKFSMRDVEERGRWNDYMQAYEDAIKATAAPHAPWFIVPADEQWETRAIVGRLVCNELERMDPRIPTLSRTPWDELEEARKTLMRKGA